jgi:hypothetical protein
MILYFILTCTLLVVGNLSFFTTEVQLHETFSVVGPIKRIIMGLNSKTKTPCGFCFIEYYTRAHACACLKYVSGTICDDRIIRCDMDGGFREGRQYGRGASGGQMRDERRTTHDPARGGVVIVGAKRGRDGPPIDIQASLANGLSSSRGSNPSLDTGAAGSAEGAPMSGAAAGADTNTLDAVAAPVKREAGDDANEAEDEEPEDGGGKRRRVSLE